MGSCVSFHVSFHETIGKIIQYKELELYVRVYEKNWSAMQMSRNIVFKKKSIDFAKFRSEKCTSILT